VVKYIGRGKGKCTSHTYATGGGLGGRMGRMGRMGCHQKILIYTTYANVKGHVETNSLELKSTIFKNSSYPLINQIFNIIKNEKLQNNYIKNKNKIRDTCVKNVHNVLNKKNKQFIVRYKKKLTILLCQNN